MPFTHPEGYHSADSAYAYPLLIKQLLNRAKAVSGDQQIVYADKLSYRYSDFFKRVARLANTLKGLGLQQGDVVAVMDWDSHRYLECYFAIPMLGLVLQTVNIRLSDDKILYTLNHAKPKALLLNSEFLPMIGNHRYDAPSIEHVIWLDDHDTPAPDFVVGEYESLLANASDDCDYPDFDENTIATTFYTSGTTGNPKGVFFSHRQIVLHALGVASALALNPEPLGLRYYDVYMPMTPMFHVNGWGIPYVATMIGIKQIYPSRYVPNALVDLIDKHQVSFTHCVPTILQMLLKESDTRDTHSFNGLKMIIGGSRLTEGLAKSALAKGVEVFTAYGMSETCPIITVATFDKNEPITAENSLTTRLATGTPVVMVDLQIWDEDGNKQPQDGKSTGEVVVRSPWLTQSYFKNHDAGNDLWQRGYLHTQDIAHMNDKGAIKVTDRLKDVIKSGGEWISSLEIETILSLHPCVADIAVIGVPDDKWGERPLALVVQKPSCHNSADDILALAEQAYERGMIPKYGIPSLLRFVDEIPKTSVGKHDKKVIRVLVAEGKL